jgi:hypothetical protein
MSNLLTEKNPIIRQTEINEAYKKYCGKFGGNKQNYFALLWLQKAFLLGDVEALKYIELTTPNLSGIDSYYLDKNSLYLFQFSKTDDHMKFADPLIALRDNGISLLFDNNKQNKFNKSPMISRLSQDISENKSTIERIVLALVFFGEPLRAEERETLNGLLDDIYIKR